ncbi:19739_t:CDS:2 [Gigaspora margarita]|uniref:19739_t:CDS:1 n=1 Tax=Gigaspora margarita TaxID=4874 RepID=A0ABN7UT78_GIGMA|nr:19739_t:CDS:2 [Gigaspora margarita]
MKVVMQNQKWNLLAILCMCFNAIEITIKKLLPNIEIKFCDFVIL